MPPLAHHRATAAATLAAAGPTLLTAVLRPAGMGDYSLSAPAGGDNAAPAIAQLAHLHIGAAAAAQPMMGLTSLLLRAPAVALSEALGHPAAYTLGALLCLLPVALLLGRAPILLALAAGAVLGFAPAVRDALASGHPEEVLTAALACAAVIAAERERAILAGVCAGLAAATKQWGLIAVVPVLWALPARADRARAVGAAVVTGVAGCGALPLLDPAAFGRAAAIVGGTHTVNVTSVWWPLGHDLRGTTARHLGLGRTPALLLGAVVTVFLLQIAGARRIPALAVLGLLATARCACDPWDLHYYWVAVLVPLALLETADRRRAPLLTLALSLIVRLDFTLSLVPVARVSAVAITAALVALALARKRAVTRPPRSLKLALVPSDH